MRYPHTITVRAGRTGSHLQGIAVDPREGHLYLSFTTCLLKTDLDGRILGSVEGIVGHLGCIAWNPHDRRLYASLEYKNDEIGRGVRSALGIGEDFVSHAFYVAIFDVDKIDRMGMDAEGIPMQIVMKAKTGAVYTISIQKYSKLTAPDPSLFTLNPDDYPSAVVTDLR